MDLRELARAMESIHPNLFHGMTRAKWQAAVADLDARIPELVARPDRLTVEFMRLVALPSRQGRDGHMSALPVPETAPPVFPLAWYMFADGLWITATLDGAYKDLVGTRVVAIGGRPIDDVLRAIDPLIGRDNRYTPEVLAPRFLLMPEVLSGVGITDSPGPTDFTVQDRAGRRRTVEVGVVPWARYEAWGDYTRWGRVQPRAEMLWTSRMGETFWWTRIASSGTVYAQLNEAQAPAADEVAAMRTAARRRDVRRVVLDLRNNPGGETGSTAVLLDTLKDPVINRRGRLFVITSNNTFSAASVFTVRLSRQTRATFVGEPMGGAVNFFADGRLIGLRRLPIPLQLQIAANVWTNAPGDPRMTIEPDIPAPITAADYFAGRDRALEAILAR